MGVFAASLSSGSNANMYFVGNHLKQGILVDAGLSYKITVAKLQQLNLSIKNIQALIITHEHSDHIAGLTSFVKQTNIPIYAVNQLAHLFTNAHQYRNFTAGDELRIADFTVQTFSKQHDAQAPISCTIQVNGIRVGVFTDIGFCCNTVTQHFSTCDAAFLESNYDVDMLAQSSYPYFLKNRISGMQGHLSNLQAFQLVQQYGHKHLQEVWLSHLSIQNNTPEKALQIFEPLAKKIKFSVSPRYDVSKLYFIKSPIFKNNNTLQKRKSLLNKSTSINQLSLFD